jgi:hypothetical protein
MEIQRIAIEIFDGLGVLVVAVEFAAARTTGDIGIGLDRDHDLAVTVPQSEHAQPETCPQATPSEDPQQRSDAKSRCWA